MPADVLGYVQSVVVDDCLYISYGYSNNRHYEPDTILRFQAGKWTRLPSCNREAFAMVSFNNQLTLVGGKRNKSKIFIKSLLVWHKEKWEGLKYPDMPIGRFSCSAVADAGILAVVGGWSNSGSSARKILDDICLLDTTKEETIHWKFSSIKMPEPCHSMRSVVIRGTCYLIGGLVSGSKTPDMFSVTFQKLKQQKVGVVSTVSGLDYSCSTPVSCGGSLCAVGGRQHGSSASDKIMVYNSSASGGHTAGWSEVGILPQAMWNCACAVKEDMLVVCGGEMNDDSSVKTFLTALV